MILLVDIQVRQRDVRYLSVVSYLQANRTSWEMQVTMVKKNNQLALKLFKFVVCRLGN